MVVYTETSQQGEVAYLPFVLEEGTGNADFLLEVAVIAGHDIVHAVVAVLQTGSKGSRREEYLIEVTYVHTSTYEGQVVGLTVCIRVLLGTVVAVTVYVLGRGIERKLVLVFLPEHVVRQASAVDDVLGLFGDIGFERFEVELVTATTELVGSVVFQAQTAELRRLVISTETEGIHVQLTDFGEAVAVHIVRIAVAVGFVGSNTVLVVFRYQRHIGTHVLFPALAFDSR